MGQICITGTGYFGAARQRVKQLSKALNLNYCGELINGVTKVLVVADNPTKPPAELLAGPEEDGLTGLPSSFADTPEVLRKADGHAQSATIGENFDSGSPSLTKFTQTPSDMQHGDASRTEQHTADTTGFSSDRMQIHKPVEGYTSDLSQHPGSSRWLPQPLQLLYGGDSSMCTPTADTMAGDSVIELSPQSVRITAERKQKRPPRHSTAASFHEVPASSIAFYDTLIVEHPELDAPLEFSIHDPCHCALVHYEDSSDGNICNLAYAQLLHCYKLAKDDRIYIEHRYLYDADDIRQQRAGSAFLEQHSMADLELVHSSEVYHSLAEVIDGEFWLVDRMTAEQTTEAAGGSKAGKARLCLFCEHSWDRLTGSLLPLVI
ncbi:g11039 [Coccomyxa viridis]|uniref:G11039 protein n=1 Tax=Coccomyxa viridis TaxID=1274662 RepID=A0ABP1G716_9CHLO